MRYHSFHGASPGVKQSFTIILDDASMTWRTEPPGNEIEIPMEGLLFVPEGEAAIGSHKRFDIFPDGRARLTR